MVRACSFCKGKVEKSNITGFSDLLDFFQTGRRPGAEQFARDSSAIATA